MDVNDTGSDVNNTGSVVNAAWGVVNTAGSVVNDVSSYFAVGGAGWFWERNWSFENKNGGIWDVRDDVRDDARDDARDVTDLNFGEGDLFCETNVEKDSISRKRERPDPDDIKFELNGTEFKEPTKTEFKEPTKSLPNSDDGCASRSETVDVVIDISKYLHMKQKDAAAALNLHPSTLSKYIKKADGGKWPFRQIEVIDEQIAHLTAVGDIDIVTGDFSLETKEKLTNLLQQRYALLKKQVSITVPRSLIEKKR